MNKRIIVIDDEESVLKAFHLILSPPEKDLYALEAKAAALEASLFEGPSEQKAMMQEHYELTTALQGEEGFKKVWEARESGCPYSLAFIDIRMPPGWDGLETARRIRETDHEIEIVIVTAYSDRNHSEIVREVGTPEKLLYIKKPFDSDEIRQLALSLTRKYDLERKAQRHREHLERLLQAVRRLKTLSISSIRGVLSAVLDEVLCFVGAQKGFIARVNEGVHVEIASEGLPQAEIDLLIKRLPERLLSCEDISRFDEILIIPLKDAGGDLFILVSDAFYPSSDERLNLLRLLLETSSEVIENVRRQEQYLTNEKIAAIGQIAAGIIHEINNPLQAIIGGTEACARGAEKLRSTVEAYGKVLHDPEVPLSFRNRCLEINNRFSIEKHHEKMTNHYSIVQNGIERVQNLMENVRGLCKSTDRVEPKFRDLGEALENTLLLTENAWKYGITVHKEWDTPLMAWCDLNGFKQVFLNLVLNAIHAMQGVGELRITGKRKGGRILLSIADTGPGIPSEVMGRVFEAFYTTKADGTGLGLTIVKRIIDRHNGAIRVESQPGEGTTFHIEIPADPPKF
ncbi:MAG TPA: ATP-binding protein [Syntrophobacteraceae bacterium]|nr:ATP-binding protein [Syntrophobacteraceae bacterium]